MKTTPIDGDRQSHDSFHRQLPVARFEFSVRQQDALRLPHYAGSMLRGAFGHALRRAACMTHEPDCRACPLYRSCPYPAIFETPAPAAYPEGQGVNPYVIEPPAMGAREVAAGDDWSFRMVLAGRALHQLPLIVHAWQRACQDGFGQTGKRAELLRVDVLDGDKPQCLYKPGNEGLSEFKAPVIPALPVTDAVRLRFLTPLRLQQNGRILGEREVDARRILMTLARRVQNLLDCHGEGDYRLPLRELAGSAEAVTAETQLQRHKWIRYSNRQQQEMDLTGLLGEVVLYGNLQPFAPLLAVGEMLHIGKNASFGLGRYQVQREVA